MSYMQHWEGTANAEQRAESLQATMRADDERLRVAAAKCGEEFGCDTPDHMADRIIELEAKIATLSQLAEAAGKSISGHKLEHQTAPDDSAVIVCFATAMDADDFLSKIGGLKP